MIFLLELKCLPPLVMIVFLTTSQNFHLLLDHPNLLCSLLNYPRSKHDTLTRITPTQRCHILPTVECFERCHFNAKMEIIIIGELNQR